MTKSNDGKSLTAPVKLTAREKELKAVTMRKAGYTLKQIADECGYAAPSGAHKAIMRSLKRLSDQIIDETDNLRALESERLDRLWHEAYMIATGAVTGTTVETRLKAMMACVQISRQRSRVQGLNKPEQVNVGNPADEAFKVSQLPSTSQQAHGILGALLSGEEGATLRLGAEEFEIEDILEALTGPVAGSA